MAYNVKTELFFLIMIKVADEAIQRNYLKEDLGWISKFAFSNRIRQMEFIV